MEQENKTQSKIVQTYIQDMTKVIEDDKSGLIKKIIHEEEEHEKEKRSKSPESKKNKFFMFMGLLFILLGLATFFYFFMQREIVPTVPMEKQFTPLIFSDKSTFIEVEDLKKEKIVQTVFNAINTTEVKNGGVEGIYFTSDKKVIGLRDFLLLIKANFLPGSNAFLVNNDFLMGVVNSETNPARPLEQSGAGGDFFILLKMRSTADIFYSLRAWEDKMFSDLQGFLNVKVTPENKYLLTKEWEDGIVKNKNARVLYDDNNQIVLMYILANDTSVIITNTKNAGEEIMLRLAKSKVKK